MPVFLDSADSRETSPKLMAAILKVAGSENDAVKVWEAPTEDQKIAIWEVVTKNGLIDASELCWGESGDSWAEEITAERVNITVEIGEEELNLFAVSRAGGIERVIAFADENGITLSDSDFESDDNVLMDNSVNINGVLITFEEL